MESTLSCGSKNYYSFEATSEDPIRMEDAVGEQIMHGYPPAQYGFYAFESDVLPNGVFIATWKCSPVKEVSPSLKTAILRIKEK